MRRPASPGARWAILQCYINFVTGTLFVVATPIGNLEDITLRALRILREVDVVAAEDTRRTGNLLRHYQVNTPLVSVHEHNERSRIPQVLDRLRAGSSIALVSDAGTPGVSDPGAELIRAVRTAGFSVVPVPGPSAVAAVISVSGVSNVPFVFEGFVPSRSNDRKKWAARIALKAQEAIICFETPHRLLKTLAELHTCLGDRPIFVGREVTKLHEEWREGSARGLADYFAQPQGEFVLLIRPAEAVPEAQEPPSDEQIADVFGHVAENQRIDRRTSLRVTAENLGVPVKAVYNALERVKKLAK